MEEFFSAIFGVIISSGTIGYILRFSLEREVKRRDKETAEKKKIAEEKIREEKNHEIERLALQNDLRRANGRVLFWIIHGIKKLDTEHVYFNGELQDNFQKFKAIEDSMEALDNNVIASAEKGD